MTEGKDEGKDKTKAKGKPKAKAKPAKAAKVEAKTKAEAEPKVKAKAKAKAKAEAEPKVKAKAKPKAKAKTKAEAEPKVKAKAKPKAKAKAKAEPKVKAKAKPEADATPKGEPKAEAKVRVEAKAEPEAKAPAQPKKAVAPVGEPEAAQQPSETEEKRVPTTEEKPDEPAAAVEEQKPPDSEMAEREPSPPRPAIRIADSIVVHELAKLMRRSPIDVIKQLMNAGVMVNINQSVDFDTAAIVAEEMGYDVAEEEPQELEVRSAEPERRQRRVYGEEEQADLIVCPPVVTVMGHVDHGKTSLLDVIRETDVVAGEAGGITQSIGAYQVERDGKKITFLDTPGHEAFTAMRARGAKATDIVVLVVAADDGVMPQTIEAIDHARAAGVPIIVALNKIDKENANVDGVKQHLADIGLAPEDWGGNTICVSVSARKRIGIDALLETILLVAEMEDLKANPKRSAAATVIEGRLDRTKGPLATLLIEDGTLRSGDCIVINDTYGKIKAMFDHSGRRVKSAGPATPVVVLGLRQVPRAGDRIEAVKDEKTAKAIAVERLAQAREAGLRSPRRLSLEEVFAQMQAGEIKELNLILKADAQGSIAPVVNSLERLGDAERKVHFIRQATGGITESDVMLARASNAIVVGFNVSVDPAALRMAETEGIDVRLYDIIYRVIEDIDRALTGLMDPVYEDVTVGRAQVLAVFRIPQRGRVAGVRVIDGKALRSAMVRVLRDGKVIHDGKMASLRRFTEDVSEVGTGFECGIGLETFRNFEEGDVLEFYRKERVS